MAGLLVAATDDCEALDWVILLPYTDLADVVNVVAAGVYFAAINVELYVSRRCLALVLTQSEPNTNV